LSHRITIEEARQKYEHEKEIFSKLKEGYKSDRTERRRQKRIEKEKFWIDYIKRRGGIKEKKEKKYEKERDTAEDNEQRKEV